MAIFLAFRPWLLLAFVALVAGRPVAWRAGCYALAIGLAATGEGLLVARLGGGRVLADGAWGAVAGLGLAFILDLLFLSARRAEPRFATMLGLLLGLGLLSAPGPLRLFERVALPTPPTSIARGGRVALLTGLPIVWGEGDAPLPTPPNATYARLAAEFRLVPLDHVTPAALAGARVLLAAQPWPLEPAETVAIDAWVRGGGRALLLADPDLRWPTDLPPGDPRRAPREIALAPLLGGWGVTVFHDRPGVRTVDIGRRRIVVDGIGRISAPGCTRLAAGGAADCAIGRGRVLIVADADMLDDRLWVGPGGDGAGRLRRGGDNALLLAERLDALAGARRDRDNDSAFWLRRSVSPWDLPGAAFPAALCCLSGMIFRRRAGQVRKDWSHMLIHRNK